jgi:hypothetical protein
MTKHHSKPDSALKLFDTKSHAEFMRPFMVPPGQKISLDKDYDPDYEAHYLKKSDSESDLQEVIEALAHYQDMLYA